MAETRSFDREAEFERLVLPLEDRMMRTVWRVTRDPELAEDAFQQALLTTWRKLPQVTAHPNPRAIVLQGAAAAVIALSGRYEQILNYVVSVDFISMGLTGAALFVYRRRGEIGDFRTPGHPFSTLFFHRYPRDSAIGLLILAIGLPVSFLWGRHRATPAEADSPEAP